MDENPFFAVVFLRPKLIECPKEEFSDMFKKVRNARVWGSADNFV